MLAENEKKRGWGEFASAKVSRALTPDLVNKFLDVVDLRPVFVFLRQGQMVDAEKLGKLPVDLSSPVVTKLPCG